MRRFPSALAALTAALLAVASVLVAATPAQALLGQMGGVSGLIYSALPVAVLVPVNTAFGLVPAICSALAAAAAVLVSIAQLAMTHAFRSLSVARGSAIQMLLPLLTTVGGMAFFEEHLEPLEIAAALLTL